jgi:hypothetical protein
LRLPGCVVAPLIALALLARPVAAQVETAERIEDNSFLLEEAYNQTAGVVQHIGTFSIAGEGDGWDYTFTQEWPFPTQRHQLSYTIPVTRVGGATGIGDVSLSYRYQLLDGSISPIALAPRLTVLLPTGSEREGRGAGGPGLQLALPVSILATRHWALHTNASLTSTPTARNRAGDEATTTAMSLGQSAIWLASRHLNVMLEALWTRDEVVARPGSVEHETGLVVSPGLRGAIDTASGVQIVPGIALPLGVGPSYGEHSIFFYLSIEHPFSDAGR